MFGAIIVCVTFALIFYGAKLILRSGKKYGQDLYTEKLSDLKWKRKREKILERDNYTCQYCGSHNNLQVHHKYYMKYPNGSYADPWDYPDDKLITLCETCHKEWHKKYKVKTYYGKWGVHYNENP